MGYDATALRQEEQRTVYCKALAYRFGSELLRVLLVLLGDIEVQASPFPSDTTRVPEAATIKHSVQNSEVLVSCRQEHRGRVAGVWPRSATVEVGACL